MNINVSYDQSQSSLPAGFVNAINYVVNYYDTLFTNNVTINLHVGYGEIKGQSLPSNALGASEVSNYISESYSSVRNALLAEGAPGSSSLSPLSGALYMSPAEANALGLGSASVANYYVGFSSAAGTFGYVPNIAPPSNEYYFVGVVEHEISEDMGRVSLLNDQPQDYAPIDLFRYSSPGVRDLTTGGGGSTAYFSIDNGATNLGTWNNQLSNGDLADWYPSGPAPGGNDAYNDYSNPGVINIVSANDVTLLQALGWTAANALTIQTDTNAFGSVSLAQVGNNYFLYAAGTTTGPELMYGGAPVTVGEFAGWSPIGAAKTASGYDIAWKNAGAGQYTAYSTDSNGNYTGNIIGAVSGTSSALENLELTFNQDLNRDGHIGPPPPPSTSLAQAGSNYSLTGMLQLDTSSNFSGTVAGMTGQDTLDLRDINSATVQKPTLAGTTSGGTLPMTNGNLTANIALLGNYIASTFVASSDGHGGSPITDPEVAAQNQLAHPHT